MKKINFYDVICLLILRGKTLSIYCLITLHDNAPSLSRIFTKYANEWPPRKKIRKGSTRKKINTKKEPEVVNTKKDPEVVNTKKEPEVVNTKKDPEVVTTKKEPEVVNTKKDAEVVNTKKKPEVVNTKKEPEVTRDLWPLTLTRKRPTLTTFQSVIFKIYSITRNSPTLKLKLSFGTNFLSNFC